MLYELILIAHLLFPEDGLRMRIIERPQYFATESECHKHVRVSVERISKRIQKIVSDRKKMAQTTLVGGCKKSGLIEAGARRVNDPA